MNDFDDRVLELMRGLTADDIDRDVPPPSVWAGIAAAVAEDADGAGGDAPQPAPLDRPRPIGVSGPVALGRTAQRRRQVLTWTLAAAAASVVVVGAALVVDGRRAGAPDVIAAVEVTSDGLGDAPPGIVAQAVIEDDDGVRRVALDASAIEVADGEFLELWLINDDITDMVSLGVVRRGETYEIPGDVELGDFPIIDVSIEPDDGIPTHSGRSVLRGRLEA